MHRQKKALTSNLKQQNKIAKFRIISELLSEMNCTDIKEWIVQLKVDIITSFPKFHMQISNSQRNQPQNKTNKMRD